LTNGLPPWDLGVLHAHWLAMGTTREIRERVDRGRRSRRGLLARFSLWRRRYLDGMMWALEAELARRARSEVIETTGARETGR
jgi:hypothetical protein